MRRGGSGILLAALALLGCRPDPTRSPNVLKLANIAEPASLDPARVAGMPEARIATALFEGLTRLSGDSARPDEARSWDVSGNGLVWTFHLVPRTWSDGHPVTARDYVWSWNRAAAPAMAAPYAESFKIFRGGAERLKNGRDTLLVRAPDDSTLQLELAQPTPILPQLLAQPVMFPVERAVVERFGDSWTDPVHFVCNGPWRLGWWHPYRSLLAVARRDRSERPGIDSLLFLPVEDPLTAWQMSRAGQVDWLFQLPLSRQKIALRRPGFRSTPQYATYFYRLNVTRRPCNDRRVRQALQLSLPREAITRFVTGSGEEPATGLVPASPRYRPAGTVKTDFVKARALLAQAGYPGGRGFPKLEILYNSLDLHRRIAEVVVKTWRDSLGIPATLVNYEWKSYLEAMEKLDYQVVRSSWVADYLDPQSFLEIFRSGSGNNRTGWKSRSYDSLLDLALSQPSRRQELFRKAEALLLDEAPILPVYVYRNLEWRNPRLTGIAESPLGLYDWTRVRWSRP